MQVDRPLQLCIVGKNSSVAKRLNISPTQAESISHSELQHCDLRRFDRVLVLSWASGSLDENLDLLRQVPPEKLVFVSTQAVFSLMIRPQWAAYPNWKKAAEDFVLAQGGRVLRIASVDERIARKIGGWVAITEIDAMRQFVLEGIARLLPGTATNLFEFKHYPEKLQHRVAGVLCRMSKLLPPKPFAQIPFALLAKIIGTARYSYNSDAQDVYARDTQIGYGALGGFFDTRTNDGSSHIIVSWKPNLILERDGFNHTKIGKSITGLGAFWHGVSTWEVPGTKFVRKSVLAMIPRPKPPRARRTLADIESIAHDGNLWTLSGQAPDGREVTRFTSNLTLAAGWHGNISLLSCLHPLAAALDDDENAIVGSCTLQDTVASKMIRVIGPFVVRQNGLRLTGPDTPDFFIEVRPFVPEKHAGSAGIKYYLDDPKSIFFKLLRGFNPRRLNEAFFNKFGVALRIKTMTVFVQVLAKNCIQFSATDGVVTQLSRNRLSENAWQSILQRISEALPSFERDPQIGSIDGLHVTGGMTCLQEAAFQHLLADGRLRVLGVPNDARVDPFHTTRRLQQALFR